LNCKYLAIFSIYIINLLSQAGAHQAYPKSNIFLHQYT
jgi:hypothetical protein